jgi:hypothetical protein
MKTKSIFVTLCVLLVSMLAAYAESPIIYRVSAGGPDACEAFGQPPFICTDHPDVDLYNVPKGQVTVQYNKFWWTQKAAHILNFRK